MDESHTPHRTAAKAQVRKGRLKPQDGGIPASPWQFFVEFETVNRIGRTDGPWRTPVFSPALPRCDGMHSALARHQLSSCH